jgi:hypothetical protein
LSKNGLKISIISNIKNKRFEVNNIKKGDGMFFLLVAFLGIFLLSTFWSVVFGIIDFFKELKDKKNDSV